MKYNPSVINFVHTQSFVDGTPFSLVDYAGLEFAFREVGSPDWTPTVSVPVSFSSTTLDISALSLPENLPLELTAKTVATNGTSSEWATPSPPFSFDHRVPSSPSLSVV